MEGKMIFKDLHDLVYREKMKRERANAVKKFAVGAGIFAGAVAIGVVTGIMIAPKSGKETRKDLMKKAEETVESIKSAVHKTSDTVKASAADVAQNAKEAVKDAQAKAKDVKKDIKNGYREVKQTVHKTAEKVSDSLKNRKSSNS
jgi:gas vesicle protein